MTMLQSAFSTTSSYLIPNVYCKALELIPQREVLCLSRCTIVKLEVKHSITNNLQSFLFSMLSEMRIVMHAMYEQK